MTTINEVMTATHRVCDRYFAAAEEAVAEEDWPAAEAAWGQFSLLLEKHMTVLEEGLLFPAFEAVNGPAGPTQMMRMEHDQMRTMVGQIRAALSARDMLEFLGLAETLMLLMQQHNMKEEQILYPMMDQSIDNAAELAGKLKLE
mgnify:CR=1 FL=1